MAMYVLLRCEDDEEAQRYYDEGYSVVGMFKVPTQFCDCGKYEPNKPQARGAKYGWFLCPHCHKPPLSSGQLPINILPLEDEAANDPIYKDHTLHLHRDQNIGKHRRQKALALIAKDKQVPE